MIQSVQENLKWTVAVSLRLRVNEEELCCCDSHDSDAMLEMLYVMEALLFM